MNINMNNIAKGDKATLIGSQIDVEVEFLGFSDMEQQYGKSGHKFDTFKEAKTHYGVKSIAQLEAKTDALEYGFGVYGIFRDVDDSTEGTWNAYLFEGKWCIGSGAEKIRLFGTK